jgi:hypothetical protein
VKVKVIDDVGLALESARARVVVELGEGSIGVGLGKRLPTFYRGGGDCDCAI